MRLLRIGILVAAATLAASSAVASPAAATVLCKNSSGSICELGAHYGAGTEINSHLETGTRSLMENVAGEAYAECKESNLNLKTTNTGSTTETVLALTEAFTFGKCEGLPWAVLKNPSIELHWIPETSDARITETGLEMTMFYLFSIDCFYSGPGTQAMGTLKGGAEPEIWMEITLARAKGTGCPEKMKWLAIYEVTAPNPLYVRSG